MSCGAQLGDQPRDSLEVGRGRARRLLEGLTDERRRLLPPAFLDAVEDQAAALEGHETTSGDFSTISGSFASADSSGELQLGPAIRTFLGPRRRDHPSDVITQPDFPAILTGPPVSRRPHRLERPVTPPPPPPELASAEPPVPRTSEPRGVARDGVIPGLARPVTDPGIMGLTVDPIWADAEMDILDGSPSGDPRPPTDWEEPFVSPPHDSGSWDVEPPPRVTDSLDGDISWGSVAPGPWGAEDIHSVYDLEPLDQEPPDSPLHRALKAGTGPFGTRARQFRLVMLPDDGYRGRIHFLQHRLAQTLELDLFKARQYLQRTIPTFLVAGEDRMELRGMNEHLGAGGVVALLLERDRWLEGTSPFLAVSAEGEGPGPVTFRDAEGRDLVVYRADISWGAVGEIRSEGAIDAFTSLDGASISLESRSGVYHLLDLFRYSSRAPIRIRSDRFDFDCLRQARKLAAAVNMRAAIRWLSPEDKNPLRPDDSFKRIPAVAGMAARGELDDEAVRIPPREVDFTEYTLLLDAGRRHGK